MAGPGPGASAARPRSGARRSCLVLVPVAPPTARRPPRSRWPARAPPPSLKDASPPPARPIGGERAEHHGTRFQTAGEPAVMMQEAGGSGAFHRPGARGVLGAVVRGRAGGGVT